MSRYELLAPLASGALPDRSRLAEVIAALSIERDGHVSRAEDIQSGIDAGARFWHYNGRYWECWWQGDMGTMAMDTGPSSTDEAWAIVVERGFIPEDFADARRHFVARTHCLSCERERTYGRCYCGSEYLRVEDVAAMPIDVDMCAVLASDPQGVQRAEAIARRLGGDAAIAWRPVRYTDLAQGLVDAELESQYPLLELGYAIDPYSLWDGGIVLAMPMLSD